MLTPQPTVPRSVYDSAAFFAVVAIDKAYEGYLAAEAPPEKLLQDVGLERFRRY